LDSTLLADSASCRGRINTELIDLPALRTKISGVEVRDAANVGDQVPVKLLITLVVVPAPFPSSSNQSAKFFFGTSTSPMFGSKKEDRVAGAVSPDYMPNAVLVLARR